MAEKMSQAEYTAKNINVLKGLEAVRKRPAMYIGDVEPRRAFIEKHAKYANLDI